MSHGLHPDTVNYVVPGDLSISVELSFYLIFPVLIRFITTRERAAALLFLLVACHASGLLTADPGLEPRLQEMWNLSLPTHFVAFAFGLYVYFSYIENRQYDRSMEAVLILATAFLLIMCRRERPWVPAYSATFGVIALCMANGAGRWLSFGLVRRLGEISYSVYLLHFCIIDLVAWMIRRTVPDLLGQLKFAILLPSVLAVAMVVCSLTYRFIERPGIRLGGRLASRLAAARKANPSNESAAADSRPAPPMVRQVESGSSA